MNDKASYWIDIAAYDLDTAKAMLETKRYLYVGFMCHQTIEKAMKALLAESGEFPPKIHNLLELAERNGLVSEMTEDQMGLIRELNPLNIESRYPSYQEKINAVMTGPYCSGLYERTEELFQWIKGQL